VPDSYSKEKEKKNSTLAGLRLLVESNHRLSHIALNALYQMKNESAQGG
jgi:hypothetical protein